SGLAHLLLPQPDQALDLVGVVGADRQGLALVQADAAQRLSQGADLLGAYGRLVEQGRHAGHAHGVGNDAPRPDADEGQRGDGQRDVEAGAERDLTQ
ncbi:MAG: hypothetical protein ACK56I_11300, partial [bacterium]